MSKLLLHLKWKRWNSISKTSWHHQFKFKYRDGTCVRVLDFINLSEQSFHLFHTISITSLIYSVLGLNGISKVPIISNHSSLHLSNERWQTHELSVGAAVQLHEMTITFLRFYTSLFLHFQMIIKLNCWILSKQLLYQSTFSYKIWQHQEKELYN